MARSRDVENRMWAEACEMLERADRLRQQFFHPGQLRAQRAHWEPPVDIFETDDAVHVIVALPGVAADHVQVTVQAGTLAVTGIRALPVDARGARLHRLEIPHGRFERRLALGSGPFELLQRELLNGCLYLALRKR